MTQQNQMSSKSAPVDATVKTIKSISSRNFDISLVQAASGGFRVLYAKGGGEVTMSEPVFDYKMAAYMFDVKLQELEGH